MAERTKDVWGKRTPFPASGEWPVRADEFVLEQPERWVASACVLCSNGCGIDIGVKDGRIVGVRGRADDRVNRGRLGPKGLYGWQANNSPDRLRRPLVRRDGELCETSWAEAMRLIVSRSPPARVGTASAPIVTPALPAGAGSLVPLDHRRPARPSDA